MSGLSGKRFMLADYATTAECEALGAPKQPVIGWESNRDGVYLRAKATGEFRPPLAGEWYLSGATVQAYRAPNNLTTAFHIARLIAVDRRTRVQVTEL